MSSICPHSPSHAAMGVSYPGMISPPNTAAAGQRRKASGREPTGTDHDVVIGPEDIFAFRGIDGAIARARNSALLLRFAPNRKLPRKGCDDFVVMVGAAIVD